MTQTIRIGGNFAPPLPLEKVAEYRIIGESLESQIKEPFLRLCSMVEQFYETPESDLPGTPHPSGRGVIVPLSEAEMARIWDAIPWPEELEMYSDLFDRLSPVTHAAERNAAYHLLWFARELDLDREPITNDKV